MSELNPEPTPRRQVISFAQSVAMQRRTNSESENWEKYPTRSQRESSASRSERFVPVVADLAGGIDLKEFSDERNLKIAFDMVKQNGGLSGGIDGVRLDQIVLKDVFEGLRVARDRIRLGDYRPRQSRVCRIPKADGGVRTLRIPTCVDRTVAKALDSALAPFWNHHLPSRRLDTWQILAGVSKAVRQSKHFIYAGDITACFDNVPTQEVIRVQRQYLRNSPLLPLIEKIACGAQGLDRERGVDQGNPYSSTLVEAYLYRELDTAIIREHDNVSYQRYVDNIVLQTIDEQECNEVRATCERLMDEQGMTLHGMPPQVLDLRNSSDETLELLGFNLLEVEGELVMDIPRAKIEKLIRKLYSASTGPNPRAEQLIMSFFSFYACITVDRANRHISELRDRQSELKINGVSWIRVQGVLRRAGERWGEMISDQAPTQ